jgi:hypothetical protein
MSDLHFGGCACGTVRYRVHGMPSVSTVCHCRFCQRRLASAFAVLATFPEQSVELIQGELAECEHRSDESGRWLKVSFCPRCGTTIFHAAQIRPGFRSVAAGTFDEQDWFSIDRHIWARSKRPWVTIPEGMATYSQAAPPPGQSGPKRS